MHHLSRKYCGLFCFFTCLLIFILTGKGLSQTIDLDEKKYKSWLAKRPYIAEIKIDGNQFLTDSKIKSQMFSRRNSFLEMFKTGSRHRVLRYSVYRDTLAIKYLYYTEGFLGVSVAELIEIQYPDSQAIINVRINEGIRYLIGWIFLESNDSLGFNKDLLKVVGKYKTGDPINPVRINSTVFDLKTVFANNGYPYARVEHEIDSSAGAANIGLTFYADEGPLVHFGSLRINDMDYYHPSLVKREVTFKEGEKYSRKKILESQKRLYSTNLFNSIDINPERTQVNGLSGSEFTHPDFVFSALERKPHFLSVKTGAGQDLQQDLIWDITASWGKRNIFRSRRIEFLINSRYIIFTQWRPLSHRFQGKYTEPWFLKLRLPLTLTGRYEPGVRSQIQPYRIQRWSVSLSTYKEWSQQLYATLAGEYENVDIYGVEIDQRQEIQDTIRVRRKLTFTLARDTRLDKFIPRQGSFTTYLIQYVGGILGGNDNFLKFEYSWARYQPLIGSAIYATRLKAGWVKEFGAAHSVPTDDRFYLGGANSIRGFKENNIGPRDEDGINVGANAYTIFNQEIRVPLFWKFWGSIFTDIGNGWESFSDVDFDALLFAYGAGLQFLSPAGPIRLDYAHRFENGPFIEDSRYHVTILYAF